MVSESKATVVVEKTEEVLVTKSTQSASQENGSTTVGVKRQRTLGEMFGTSSKPSHPAKKAKLEAATKKSEDVTTTPSAAPVVTPFDTAAFQGKLSDEEKRLLRLECGAMNETWLNLLKDEIRKPYFMKLKRFLWQEGVRDLEDIPKPLKCYPHPRDIYAWSNTPVGKVKVVIIGQDPYHNTGQAHGLCFSVPKGVTVPPSLRNIYAEIKAEYPDFVPPKHGNLKAWVDDGVMLLNSCLTVRANTAASHSKQGWEEFTDKIVDLLDKHGGSDLSHPSDSSLPRRGLVWMAWGSFAIKRVARLDKKKHLILSSPHPSPLSAHRGFLGNGHFKKANSWLEERYGAEGKVDWCHLP